MRFTRGTKMEMDCIVESFRTLISFALGGTGWGAGLNTRAYLALLSAVCPDEAA